MLFKKATDLGLKFDVTPSLPHTRGRQTNRDNVPAETPEIYYRRVITVPYLDYLISELDTRFSDHQRKSMMALSLIPSVLVTDNENQDQILNNLTTLYEDELPSPRTFYAELLLWKDLWKAQDAALLPSTPVAAVCHACKLLKQVKSALPKTKSNLMFKEKGALKDLMKNCGTPASW